MRYGVDTPSDNLDPDFASTGPQNTWLFPAYDRLVHVAPEDGEFIPGLATSWELSDDGLTLTMTLREGVVFHDGTPFDADAVVANIERSKTLEGSVNAGPLEPVESVEAVDGSTVRFNLTQPSASMIGVLSDKPGAMISPRAIEDGTNLSETMVGAGMFRLDSFAAGDRAVFSRFEDYWDPDVVRLDQLELVELAEPTARTNALLDSQIDAARISPSDLNQVTNAGFVVDRRPTLEVWYVGFNYDLAGLDERLVRQAMVHAVDKQAIVDSLFDGVGTVVSEIFPPGYYANDPDTPEDLYPHDPDRAQELLGEAGFDGSAMEMRVPIGYEDTLAVAEVLQAAWAPLGIDVEVTQTERNQLVDDWLAGEVALLPGAWSGRPDPNLTNFFLYAESSSFINVAHKAVPEIEELLVQSEAAVGSERTDMLRRISALTAEEVLHLPLFALDFVHGYSEAVEGLDIYMTGKTEFRGVSIVE